MYRLNIPEKTGFRVLNPNAPILIRDKWGKLFYTTETMTPKVRAFNLPRGEYIVETGLISEEKIPVIFKLPTMPSPERVLPFDPSTFKIIFAPNPSKCTINWFTRVIKFDTSFKEKSIPVFRYILYHEFGHKFFKTEKYCDLFAVCKMLNEGFNPSQIGRAQIETLSDKADYRKIFIINNLIKNANS